MNPRIAKVGRSFKGACYYYSHDKGADTSERLGFVEFINLPINESGNGPEDSDRAAKVMAYTALHWEDLQRHYFEDELERTLKLKPLQPGEKRPRYRRPPRPPEKPVFAYSLRFHPDDKDTITKELLLKAARGSLAALDMEGYQAVIYEHTDFDKSTPDAPDHPPHVHVVVNKVHPLTGKSHTHSCDRLLLSKFAQSFGKKHGLKRVMQREQNNAERERRAAMTKEQLLAEGLDSRAVLYEEIPRSDYERFKHYRGKSQEKVRRMRALQQEHDRKQLDQWLMARLDAYKAKEGKLYDEQERYFQDALAATQRVITLDHMSLVFRVFTRLKQRFTGELARERRRQRQLEKSLNRLLTTKQAAREQLQNEIQTEIDRLDAVHRAQLKQDDAYFERERARRRSETAGEAGRKTFNAQTKQRSAKEPPTSIKAKIVDALKAVKDGDPAQAEVSDSTVTKKKKKQDKKTGEALKKLYRRKEGRGANRDPNRKRKSRSRSRDKPRGPSRS